MRIPMTTNCLILGLVLLFSLPAAGQQRTPKELFEYIENARKLGLNDDQIRANALGAGWDAPTIEHTYTIVRMLNNEKLQGGDRTRVQLAKGLPGGYRIGPGDLLQIVVWREPEASVPDAVVRVDGKISVPLIKEIEVVGLTPKELEETLTEKFAKFINGPDVTVIPKQINSMKVYLMGAVKKEGPLPMLGPLTVLQAINEAGGLSEYARKNKIYILRNDGGKQLRLPFDYEAILEGKRLEQNIVLRPDDMIVVPQ